MLNQLVSHLQHDDLGGPVGIPEPKASASQVRAGLGPVAQHICELASLVSGRVATSPGAGGDEAERLHIACSFYLLCAFERELAESFPAATVAELMHTLIVTLVKDACRKLFPEMEAEAAIPEYFSTFFETNYRLCTLPVDGKAPASTPPPAEMFFSGFEDLLAPGFLPGQIGRLLWEAWSVKKGPDERNRLQAAK